MACNGPDAELRLPAEIKTNNEQAQRRMGATINEVMAFAPGDEVHVAALGKGVVRDVRNGGRYLVALKGRSIVAAEAQLRAVSPRKRTAPPGVQPPRTSGPDFPR